MGNTIVELTETLRHTRAALPVRDHIFGLRWASDLNVLAGDSRKAAPPLEEAYGLAWDIGAYGEMATLFVVKSRCDLIVRARWRQVSSSINAKRRSLCWKDVPRLVVSLPRNESLRTRLSGPVLDLQRKCEPAPTPVSQRLGREWCRTRAGAGRRGSGHRLEFDFIRHRELAAPGNAEPTARTADGGLG